MIGDHEANVEPGKGPTRTLLVTVPEQLPTGTQKVLVYASDGTTSAAKELTVASGVRIASVHPTNARPGEAIHVYGAGFVAQPPGHHATLVEVDGRPAELRADANDTYLVVTLPGDLQAPGQAQLVVANTRAQRSEAFPVPLVA